MSHGWLLGGNNNVYPTNITLGPNSNGVGTATSTDPAVGSQGNYLIVNDQILIIFRKDTTSYAAPLQSAFFGKKNQLGDWRGAMIDEQGIGAGWYLAEGSKATSLPEPPATWGPPKGLPGGSVFSGVEKALSGANPSDVTLQVTGSFDYTAQFVLKGPSLEFKGFAASRTPPGGPQVILLATGDGRLAYGVVVSTESRLWTLTGIGYRTNIGTVDESKRALTVNYTSP